MTFPDLSDTRHFRRVMGMFATGVTVVVARHGDEVRGMTANALASLSLDPLLILIAVDKKAHWAEVLHLGAPFSINFLRASQADLSRYFAGGARRGMPPPDFRFVPWHGAERLEGCLAAVVCQIQDVLEGGDHWIVIGQVTGLYEGEPPHDPLIFYGGHYRALVDLPDHD